MTRLSSAALLFLVAVAATACGNYSREDLLFRAAVPTAADIAIVPPGAEAASNTGSTSSTSQALSVCGGEGGLRCQGEGIANGLNNLTFGLLDILDNIVSLPVSNREVGRRVWGPHYDARTDGTFRFEMIRARDENGELTGQFVHCLHMARGDAREASPAELSCDDEVHEGSGLTRVLFGIFTPGTGDEEGGVRAGAGQLVLDGNKLNALNPEFDIKAVLDIGYDNLSEPSTIGVHIHDVGGESRLPDEAMYAYEERLDGSGSFVFGLRTDMNPLEGAPGALELYLIRARWQSDNAGRADALVTEGDLGDQSFEVTECWDAALATSYFRDPDPAHPDVGGDPLVDCAFAEALPLQ